MKRSLFAVLFLFTAMSAVPGRAGDTDQAHQWQTYHVLHDAQQPVMAQIEDGTYDPDTQTVATFADKYVQIAALANSLGRQDIAAWQYNNAAYALIMYVKNATAWNDTMDEIKDMPTDTKEQRQAKLDQAREIRSNVTEYQGLLMLASTYLDHAKDLVNGLDNAEDATGDTLDCGDKVESNKEFVSWALDFIQKPL